MQIKKLISKSELNPLSKRAELILLGLCLGISSLIFIYSTWGGLIWTSDSFHYWAASRSFLSDGVLRSHGGGSYVYWPPLLPIILSFFSEDGYHIFQGLVLNISLISIYIYLRQLAGTKNGILTTALFSISIFPYLISTFLWSELIFIVFLYLGLFYHAQWQKSKQTKYLLIAALLFLLMCLQRNAGVLILTGASIHYASIYIKAKQWKKLLASEAIIFIILLPNLLWNLLQLKTDQNYDILSQNYFNNMVEVISNGLIALSKVVIPHLNDLLALFFGVILLLLAIKQLPNLLSTVLIVYFLIFSIFPSSHYGITDRFLAPIIPLIFFSLTNTLSKTPFKKRSFLKTACLLLLILIISYNGTRTYKNTKMWHERSITNPKAAKIFF